MNDPAAGRASSRQFGPWTPGFDPGERLARLRTLRALTRLLLGPRGVTLAGWLHRAETNNDVLIQAADELVALALLDMRKVLGSYAALSRSVAPGRRAIAAHGFRRPMPWLGVRGSAYVKSPAERTAGRG